MNQVPQREASTLHDFDYQDNPIMDVLLAQEYEKITQTVSFREEQDFQRAMDLSLSSSTNNASTISSCPSAALSTTKVQSQKQSSPDMDPTRFDHILAKQEEIRARFHESQESLPKSNSKPLVPPQIIVSSGGVSQATVPPGNFFDAVWDLKIKEDSSYEGRAEWGGENGISLQPWGTRRFAPEDCGLRCIHQEKIELEVQSRRNPEDETEIYKTPSITSSAGRESRSVSSGKKGDWRNIRIIRLHLRAPSEEGEYEEVWRLRMKTEKDFRNHFDFHDFGLPFGDLFIIRIRVDATPSTNRTLDRGLTAPVGVSALSPLNIGQPSTSRIKILKEPPTYEDATKDGSDSDWVMAVVEDSETSDDNFSLISSKRSSFEKIE